MFSHNRNFLINLIRVYGTKEGEKKMEENNKKQPAKKETNYLAIGTAIGAGIGSAIGVGAGISLGEIFMNTGFWAALGTGVGIAVGAGIGGAIQKKKRG